MIATVLAEGQRQRVTSVRMNRAFGQKRLARGTSPETLPQATVIGGLRANRISGDLRSNGQQPKRPSFKKWTASERVRLGRRTVLRSSPIHFDYHISRPRSFFW